MTPLRALLSSCLILSACSGDFSTEDRPSPAPSISVVENLRMKDPAADGWNSEVLHDQSKKPMHLFLDALFQTTPLGEDPHLPSWQNIRVSPLLPTGITEIFTGEDTRVFRGAPLSGIFVNKKDTSQFVDQFLEHLADAQVERVDIKIVGVIPSEHGYTTDTHVHVLGTRLKKPFQLTLRWIFGWDFPQQDQSPVLRSISAINYEEVLLNAPLFAERTGFVFARHPFFRTEFLRGAHEYHQHQDRLDGFSFMGLQGAALGDINGDGLEDLYVAQGGGLPNRLFLHLPNGSTQEVAQAWGVDFLENTHGVLLVDLDNDGDKDIALGMGHYVFVGYNLGNRFGDFAVLAGKDISNVHGLSAADADLDGDLDLYAAHYSPSAAQGTLSARPKPYHDAKNGGVNSYWRNDGYQKWVDATVEVGLDADNSRFSFSSAWEDFDNDGDLDLFVANDYGRNNVYRNDQGHFEEIAEDIGMEGSAASMGMSFSDYDLDGDMDLYVSNMFSSAGQRITALGDQFMKGKGDDVVKHYRRHARGNTLYENKGDGTFTDVTEESGTALGRWAWGAMFTDFDNDGLEDIYIPNGFITNTDTHDL